MTKTMKEAHVHKDTSVTIHDVPTPCPGPKQVLIKVMVSGCNPKDWKMPAGMLATIEDCPNSGDDIAGIVEAVGSEVLDFHPGDRVAALHQLGAPYGSYAEYAIAYDYTTFLIGTTMPFEEAATIPMGALLSVLGLVGMLQISPGPWSALPVQPRPVVIYGAAGNVGAFAVKWAQLLDVHPCICVAGGGAELVETFIDRSKGDTIVNYREGNDAVVAGIREALHGQKLEFGFDCVDVQDSYRNICKVLDEHTGHIAHVFPGNKPDIVPTIRQSSAMAGALWQALSSRKMDAKGANMGLTTGGPDFGYVWSRLIGRYICEGKLVPHPHLLSEGGLAGLEAALKRMRAGKMSGQKNVIRIRDTPGLER